MLIALRQVHSGNKQDGIFPFSMARTVYQRLYEGQDLCTLEKLKDLFHFRCFTCNFFQFQMRYI